jgi:hypothetical protein
MGGTIDLEHHPFGGPSFSAASVLDPSSFLGGTDPLSSKNAPHFLSAELDLFLFFELLGQMVIVEALVLSSGQFHHPSNRLLLDLAFTGPSTITVNHSLGSSFTNSGFDPVTLPFAYSHHQCGLFHCQLAAIHSLNYV